MEALQNLLGGLLHEREGLRSEGNALALERNRREIVRVQQDICYALIAQHGTA